MASTSSLRLQLRRLSFLYCILLLLLLLVVVVPASGSFGPTNCLKTAMSVPRWCAGEFITALFYAHDEKHKHRIPNNCCVMLACVREWSCADVLRAFCTLPQAHDCPQP